MWLCSSEKSNKKNLLLVSRGEERENNSSDNVLNSSPRLLKPGSRKGTAVEGGIMDPARGAKGRGPPGGAGGPGGGGGPGNEIQLQKGGEKGVGKVFLKEF